MTAIPAASAGGQPARVPSDAKIVLATRNDHKVEELREILARYVPSIAAPGVLVSAKAVDGPEVVEDGATFTENALLKARALVAHTGLPALADDSGICVEIMGGAPGIFSARWSGYHADGVDNMNLLLAQLADVPANNRRAWFECSAVLVLPDGSVFAETGKMFGFLTMEPHGDHGFGYDPIFIPDSENGKGSAARTNAQLTPGEKNAISHRGLAFAALAPHIAETLRAA